MDRCVVCGEMLEDICFVEKINQSKKNIDFVTNLFKVPKIKYFGRGQSYVLERELKESSYTMKRCPSCQLLYGVR